MSLTSWDKFLPLLAPHVSAAPDMSMRAALNAAATDFFAETHIWIEQLDPQPIIAGEHTYDLFASGSVESVLWAALSDRELRHTHITEVPKLRLASTGQPTYFWVVNEQSIRLWPTPEENEEQLSIGVVLKPSLTASGVPSWAFETWANAIVDGAIYRLASTPGKTWSDQTRALYHKTLFDRAKANARRRDYRDIPMRAKPRAFT